MIIRHRTYNSLDDDDDDEQCICLMNSRHRRQHREVCMDLIL